MRTKLGLEVLLEEHLDLIVGGRVALLACPSSVDHELRTSVERLHQHPTINLVALFGPEHGLRGDAQAGRAVYSSIDPLTQLPVHSLYGDTHKPTAEMLRDIDIILVDLQDAGVRFYTFLATILYLMKAAQGANIAVFILDRPAPINGLRIEGPILEPAYASFVGPYPLPIRYGMTIGEIARLANDVYEIDCDLTVIPLQDWSRELWYDQTALPFIPSSPNLPTLDAVTLYPGTCLIEGTNLSEGRGTTKPFEYIGAPWINAETLASQLNTLDLGGLRFRPVYFVPTFSKYQSELCAGVQLYLTDRDRCQPIEAMLQILQTLKREYAEEFAWRPAWTEGGRPPIDLLWGSDSLRRQLADSRPVEELIDSWQDRLREFECLRAGYLLY